MFAVLGEDPSDAEMLRVLVRRLYKKKNGEGAEPKVKPKGYDGCSHLIRKGGRDLDQFLRAGFTHFIICVDADRNHTNDVYNQIQGAVIKACGLAKDYCIVVPVQEIEAWILADVHAVQKVITGWQPEKKMDFPNPESIQDPKEFLEKLIRTKSTKPPYSHATHNPRVAEHLDLDIVNKKCPSFRTLADFVVACP